MATNVKVNKDKAEALWVGHWKERQDKPLNLKWTNSCVKFLGIIVGNKVGSNGTKFLSDLNFAEQIEIIKNKINFWKGKGIALVTRVKVLNIFILSRLWYRTRIWDISKNYLNTLNKLIRNFIWCDKQGARVRQRVILLEYEKGGLQLVDITCKTNVQRVKRIMHLMSLNNDNLERFLADSLVGGTTNQSQYGLSYGLFNNEARIRTIPNYFYKKAFEIINSLNIVIKPGQINTIMNEPLFYNNLFKDPLTHEHFTLSRFKSQMPKTLKELQSFSHSRDHFVNSTAQSLRRSVNNIIFSDKDENEYILTLNNTIKDLQNYSFKELYLVFLNQRAEERER